MPKRKRTFEVLIEAKFTVHAFDAASARRKIERAFSAGSPIDADVTATGQLWVFDGADDPRPMGKEGTVAALAATG